LWAVSRIPSVSPPQAENPMSRNRLHPRERSRMIITGKIWITKNKVLHERVQGIDYFDVIKSIIEEKDAFGHIS
jgi:hypothetical protein